MKRNVFGTYDKVFMVNNVVLIPFLELELILLDYLDGFIFTSVTIFKQI